MALDSKQLRTFGFLAALVVFALGVALLLRRDAGDGAEFAGAASSPEGAAAAPGTSGANDEASTDTSSARAALQAEPANASGATDAPPEPGIELIPVVGVHRRRVAPVEVWWWQPKDPENWQELGQLERWLQSGEVDARLAEVASRLQPDSSGNFHAPQPGATGCVVARGEGLWGWTRVQRSSADPTYIQLENDETLRVRVLDASGAGAPGVRVALRQRWGPADEFGESFDIAMALSGPDGTALFPHFRALMRGSWDYDARFVVAIAEPFAAAIEQDFEPSRLPPEPLELRLPAAGSVVLELDGPAAGGQFSLRLREASSTDPAQELVPHEHFLRPAAEGEVRFPYVGLGLSLTPTSQVRGESRFHDESEALGPTRAGEERRLRIDLKANEKLGTRMVGTLVGPAIRSIGTTRVDVAIEARDALGQEWMQNLRVVVTADGRFVIPLLRESTGRTSVEFTVRGPRDERVGFASATANGRPGLTELELGEVFIDSLPLLVSGRVVDANGRRAAGAEVSVLGKRADGGSGWNDGWERSGNLRTYTDFSGNFEVRGTGEWNALGLAAWNADAASEFQVVSLGSSGVVLTLGANGGITGFVRLDSGLAREYMTVSVRREDPRTSPSGSAPYRRSEIDADGAFVVRGLAPGAYTVSVQAEGTPEAVATVGAVQVEAGKLTHDPRLEPVELGPWSELRLLDSDGRPGLHATAYLLERSSRRWTKHTMPSGKLVYDHASDPFWIVAGAHVVTRFDPASRAPSLQLERAPTLQIRVPEELLATLGTTELLLTFRSAELPPSVARLVLDTVSIRGALSQPFTLRHLPAHATTLSVTGSSGVVELPHVLSGNVSTTSVPSPQVLELRWKPEDLAAALAGAGR
ncbi:MAG: carboxypeptidase regulatory-like domain-containing protein [Planctomycetota bacterium]|nr:carboxypeptidase regulatory-like domain-containing protein [Planctomycetota bacterium]